MVQKLREIQVQEWLGPNKAEYCIWDADKYEPEANKFLQDGYFFNCLGDAMPLAMANGLNSNIVIFRSTLDLPITYISPHKPSTIYLYCIYRLRPWSL